jgi:hypothetical protein
MEPFMIPSVQYPVGRSPGDPVKVTVRVEWGNGAFREFTAAEPLGYELAIDAADGRVRSEPKLLITFAGNSREGGIQVAQDGKVPEV